MRGARIIAAAVCSVLALQAGPTPAQASDIVGARPQQGAMPTVSIDTVDRAGFGAVTLQAKTPLSFVETRVGDTIKVTLSHHHLVAGAVRAPSNVSAIAVGPSEVNITTVPGSRVRMTHNLLSVTIEILDGPLGPWHAAPTKQDAAESSPSGASDVPLAAAPLAAAGPPPRQDATPLSAPVPELAPPAVPGEPATVAAAAVPAPAPAPIAVPSPPVVAAPVVAAPVVAAPVVAADERPAAKAALPPVRAAAASAPASKTIPAAPTPAQAMAMVPTPAPVVARTASTAAPIPAGPSPARAGAIALGVPVPTLTPPPGPAPAEELPASTAPAASTLPDPTPPAPDPERTAAVAAVLTPQSNPIQMVLDSTDPAIFVPMDSHAGLAAFRRDDEMLLVFDMPAKLATTAIRSDPVFGHTVSEFTRDATIVHIPLPPPASLHLTRSTKGWEVTAIPAAEPIMGIEPRVIDTAAGKPQMQLAAGLSSRVVTILDPRTGARLLVGTQQETGQGVAIGRSLVQFSLVPTVQGVVVSAVSDDLGMRENRDGFLLFAGAQSGGTILSSSTLPAIASAGAAEPSRLFTLTNAPVASLADALRERTMAASSAPILGRSQQRIAVAEKMVALGMGVEALAVLDVAVANNPPLADTPPVIALRAISGILAGRPEEAAAIDDARLNGNDEVALWRAVRGAGIDETCPACARTFVAKMPLLLSYPQPLRDRLLPLALETMALGGKPAAALEVLKKLPNDAPLDLARGMAAEMTGDNPTALAMYGQVAQRSDRLARYRALTRSVGVRLASHDIGPGQAADALDKLLYGWRGDQRELALRIRMADLRRQTGQWRESLALLRDAQVAFPDQKPRILGELTGTLAALLDGNASEHMTPAEFVGLYDDNADLLREGPWAGHALGKLADNLLALDLPARAVPILTRMLSDATDASKRAQIGAKLASVQLSSGSAEAAIATLAQSDSPALAPELTETRQILLARALAAHGDKDKAVSVLRDLGTAAAADLRATILSEKADWPGATAALADLARLALPAPPAALDEAQQKMVMRLANAATLAGDKDTILRLAADRGAAMAAGKSADAFRLMTSAPVRTTSDISRAAREIRAAKPTQAIGTP